MASPTLRRKTLGAELRKLRTSAGDSLEQVAQLLGCSLGKVSHMETGRNSPSKTELMVLMDHYDVSEDNRALLEDTRQEARKRGWWSTYRLPSWFQGYVGMETDAVRVRTFEIELIPGLLQCESYARATNVVGRHMTEPAEVERKVSARMHRQRRLDEDPPLEIHAVISEAALRRCAADDAIGAEQFKHLADMSRREHVRLQVMPFSAGLHNSMSGSFTLLDFPEDTWPPSAYQEYAVGGHLIDDSTAVTALSDVFGRLCDHALSFADSTALLSEYANT